MKLSLPKLTVLLLLIAHAFHVEAQISSVRPSFEIDEPTVSTTFFIWYAENGGQLSGPWIPLEGRENWTGTPEWWKTQIKQVMMANIDIILVHLMHQTDERRLTLFQALYELRLEGYEVPKVAPYLDPLITWGQGNGLDMANVQDKDAFVDQYIRFYNLYFEKNPDEFAEDYLAKMDGKLILDTWHTFVTVNNIDQLTRADVENRLAAAFPDRPLFQNGVYMLTTALNNPIISFADERIVKFEVNEYYREFEFNGITTATLKGGYWDQNIRTPGDFLPRNGGANYKQAWQELSSAVDRIYVESWNEYDEGTGIYAADTMGPFIAPSNISGNTDVWSETNDPYEYIRTTAKYRADFNELPALDARIISFNLPDTVIAGENYDIEFLVQNNGNESWTGSAGFKFGIQSSTTNLNDVFDFVDDQDINNEVDIYEGIFRGRPVQFNINLLIPEDADSTFNVVFSMFKNENFFGADISHNFHVQKTTTSINGHQAAKEILFYPNPVKTSIFLELPKGNMRWEIFDGIGKNVQSGQISNSEPINVSSLKKGIYYLRLTGYNNYEFNRVFKFIKN
ncbi:T9SS type A sorting domain-containing protein [Lewinella sp. W8]|uniref:T9SS type A sorting domain-containing protein n=1 Tax=Lewinella sp. W8 TaxID=2528208 RepID=UPI001564B2E8|nr:T9SS type A sorting domain-containing protein [Lewinella sp. W8]